MSSQAIVILSGGPDSTAAALWAMAKGYDVALITFQFRGDAQYGEIFSSMRVAAALKLPHRIIDFKSPIDAFTPNMHIMMHAGVKPLGIDKSQPYLMPFGSGTLLSFAASYAIHEGVSAVIWGATADDGAAHWEYSQDFCSQLSALIGKATGKHIDILVPFSAMHKPEVVTGFAANADLFAKTWSCRTSSRIQCGQCVGCMARRVSADLAGVPDQTIYSSAQFTNPLPQLRSKPLGAYTSNDWLQMQNVAPLNCEDKPGHNPALKPTGAIKPAPSA